VLTRITTWSAIIFMCTSISLTVLMAHAGGGSALGAGQRQDRTRFCAGQARQVRTSLQSSRNKQTAGRKVCRFCVDKYFSVFLKDFY
jgi:hypothetical protein